MSVRPATTDARVALLEHLIDHAPTFPPASLPAADALAEDARAQASPHAFLLGRLVWPASRWSELGEVDRRISAVANAAVPDDPRIEAIELPPGREPFRTDAHAGLEIFVEGTIPTTPGAFAKVRCGGAATPSVEELARFLRECRGRSVPFKATAGLHRAVRRGQEHGFLNLLAAAVFGDEERALAEEDADAFALDAGAFRWGDREAEPEELTRGRRFLRSIGSCSFFEPIEELEALGVLP